MFCGGRDFSGVAIFNAADDLEQHQTVSLSAKFFMSGWRSSLRWAASIVPPPSEIDVETDLFAITLHHHADLYDISAKNTAFYRSRLSLPA